MNRNECQSLIDRYLEGEVSRDELVSAAAGADAAGRAMIEEAMKFDGQMRAAFARLGTVIEERRPRGVRPAVVPRPARLSPILILTAVAAATLLAVLWIDRRGRVPAPPQAFLADEDMLLADARISRVLPPLPRSLPAAERSRVAKLVESDFPALAVQETRLSELCASFSQATGFRYELLPGIPDAMVSLPFQRRVGRNCWEMQHVLHDFGGMMFFWRDDVCRLCTRETLPPAWRDVYYPRLYDVSDIVLSRLTADELVETCVHFTGGASWDEQPDTAWIQAANLEIDGEWSPETAADLWMPVQQWEAGGMAYPDWATPCEKPGASVKACLLVMQTGAVHAQIQDMLDMIAGDPPVVERERQRLLDQRESVLGAPLGWLLQDVRVVGFTVRGGETGAELARRLQGALSVEAAWQGGDWSRPDGGKMPPFAGGTGRALLLHLHEQWGLDFSWYTFPYVDTADHESVRAARPILRISPQRMTGDAFFFATVPVMALLREPMEMEDESMPPVDARAPFQNQDLVEAIATVVSPESWLRDEACLELRAGNLLFMQDAAVRKCLVHLLAALCEMPENSCQELYSNDDGTIYWACRMHPEIWKAAGKSPDTLRDELLGAIRLRKMMNPGNPVVFVNVLGTCLIHSTPEAARVMQETVLAPYLKK